MGAWSYCKKCERGLRQPTAEEIVNDAQVCPTCGTTNDPLMNTYDLIIELDKRIEKLELEIIARSLI